MTAVKLYWKSIYKEKEKRHKVFNVEVSDSNNDNFFFKFKEKKKINNEIAALFKKTVSKILKFKWITDSKFFLYIIN